MELAWARVGAIALAAVLLVVAAFRLLGEDREARSAARPAVAIDGAAPGQAAAKQGRGPWVHVAGAVRRPGLYRVSAGARVAEALARAGGPSPRADLTAVNLAAQVEDGQQVVVPARGAAGTAVGGPALEPGAPGAPKLSLGNATADQLDELDGIGPTLSERILEYRTEHGGFGSLEELREVEGIGEKRFESLREAPQP